MDSGQATAEMGLFEQTATSNSEVITPPPTTAKHAFITKLLHPPSAVSNYQGLPTGDTRTQVCLDYISVGINIQPSYFDRSTSRVTAFTDASKFSDYAILCPNGARVLGIPYLLNDSYGIADYMDQDYSNVMINDQYDFTKWQNDANLYRTSYKSLTTYLNATAFNDTGIVTGIQFNPNILFAGDIINMAHQQPELFYEYVLYEHSRNKYEIASVPKTEYVMIDKLGNKQNIKETIDHRAHHHFGKFMKFPKYIREQIREMLNITDEQYPKLDPDTRIQVINMNSTGPADLGSLSSPIPTPSQMMNSSARSYTGKARDGTFGVQRLNTVSPAWNTGSNTSDSQNGLYNCYAYTKSSDGSTHFFALHDNTPIGTSAEGLIDLKDTLWSKDSTWSIIYYQGLTTQYSGDSIRQFNLLAYKFYTGFEVQPTQRSAWSGLAKLAPKPDISAMNQLMDMFYELKDVLPAKYNLAGIGAIMSSIGKKVLPNVGRTILNSIAGDEKKEIKEEKEVNKVEEKLDQVIKHVNKLDIEDNPIKPVKTKGTLNARFASNPINIPRRRSNSLRRRSTSRSSSRRRPSSRTRSNSRSRSSSRGRYTPRRRRNSFRRY